MATLPDNELNRIFKRARYIVLCAMDKTPDGISRSDLVRKVAGRVTVSEMADAIEALKKDGLLVEERLTVRGKIKRIYRWIGQTPIPIEPERPPVRERAPRVARVTNEAMRDAMADLTARIERLIIVLERGEGNGQ